MANAYGQLPYRIKADITIKEKSADDSISLTKGKVYFDMYSKQVVYVLRMPSKKTIIMRDTTTLYYEGNKLVNTTKSFIMTDFSIFNMALKNNVADFGLRDSPYKLEKVEKEDSLVISTWTLYHPKKKTLLSKILLSKKAQKLHGMLVYATNNLLASKQFYEDYVYVKGVWFPQHVTQYIYTKKGEALQYYEYSNIEINKQGEDEIYFFGTRNK